MTRDLAFGLAAPWAVVAASNLLLVNGSLSDWGATTFLIFPLPFIVLGMLTSENVLLDSDMLIACHG